jgi:ribonucleoside-triphosphate reductase (thioredoxin)
METSVNEMGIYEQFIHKSRYARYLDSEQRREEWHETVQRYCSFLFSHVEKETCVTLPQYVKDKVSSSIHDMKVMPSMRAMMTAGEALARDNVAGYNCSYLPVDDIRAFDEAMFILLCGTGVGFSVERQYVNKLPEVPTILKSVDGCIYVQDSKEGWATALRKLIQHLYNGEIPRIDVSRVRPAGARLKTFGGRASGPDPLLDLFDFTINVFSNAVGRKLKSIECHDIMCKIGDVVVVGGVRRSAMISLSNLSDDRMRNAKSGAWWEHNGQRALANNSVAYTEKPDVGVFMQEWLSLYESKSGERGIFNREAARKVVERSGRRDANHDWGTNPCSEIILRPYQFCNLSELVVRAYDTEETLLEKVKVATIIGTFQSTLTHFPYLREVWARNTEEERLLGVSLTGIMDNPIIHNEELLQRMREVAVETNKHWASILGIPQSAAITCVKPSGTVSQLVDSASGIHARFAPYYIRRVRQDVKDPLTQYLIDCGVPHEPCFMKPDTTVVFSFPKKAPEGSVNRESMSAIEQLKTWLKFQLHWCEHKPSVTINVKEEEWPAVGGWVYDNFDWMSGVSFLPHDGGSYKQAPYEEIDETTYLSMMESMPVSIDWTGLKEVDDNVEGVQTLACSAGVCEI